MPAERRPGSDRGRPAISWEQAFLSYAALPSDQRTYQAVADQYQVSVRTVERHGRDEQWPARARQLDRDAAAAAAERLRDQRAEKLVDVDKLIDASYVTYATLLRDGKVRVSPADLPRLHKLRTDVWTETDRHTLEAVTPTPASAAVDPTERKLQVLNALRDAGVLEQFLRPHPTRENNETQVDAVAHEPDDRKDPDQGSVA